MQENGVSYLADGGLGLVTLADPDGGNRLSEARLTSLKKALEAGLQDESVRVLLLRAGGGPGKPWCLGMDLDLLQGSLAGASGGEREGGVSAYADLLYFISTCAKPVLALIGGPVMAGGVGLAAACDGVYAVAGASFELTEVFYGLIPANVIPFLLGRRIGMQKIKHLVMSARKCTAEEARALGLVDELLPGDDPDGALKKALRPYFRAAPSAQKATKKFLEALDGETMEEGLVRAQRTILGLMASEPVGHALGALKAGETPRWFSRPQSSQKLFFPD